MSAVIDRDATAKPPGRSVLLLGDDMRSFLATARSLGRRGVAVEAAPSNWNAPALKSRYLRALHRLPIYAGDGAEWVQAARALVAERRFDVVLPCDDASILPFHLHRAAFANLTVLAIPGPDAMEALFDKKNTRALAASLGISLARSMDVWDGDAPEKVFRALGSPVVVKPRRSRRVESLHRPATVTVVDTPEELRAATTDLQQEGCYLEEFFPGSGVGVSVLASSGDILVAFQHHRVHERPRGGASSYRVSAPLSSELADACAKIARALSYTGLAMFEFRRNFTTNDWILLEVNARPWGSLPLPLALGVDFPYYWYQLLADGKRNAAVPYEAGVYGRNFLLDVEFLIAIMSEAKSGWRRLGLAAAWLGGFANLLIGRERSDALTFDDPSPGVAELARLAASLLTRAARRVAVARWMEHHAARWRLQRILRRSVATPGPISILFVCYGNICRSPFAERVLVRKLQAHSANVTVTSAGTLPEAGRTSPPDATAAARPFGVDLGGHRSRPLTDGMAQTASVVLAFDAQNVGALRARYPWLASRVVLLGLVPAGSYDISDPYGGSPVDFQRTYALIENAVEAVYQCVIQAAM